MNKEYWKLKKGSRIDDIAFAQLAYVYSQLQQDGSPTTTKDCALLMDVNYETAKSRIRFARERGMLTKPGKGSSEKTQLTKLALITLGLA